MPRFQSSDQPPGLWYGGTSCDPHAPDAGSSMDQSTQKQDFQQSDLSFALSSATRRAVTQYSPDYGSTTTRRHRNVDINPPIVSTALQMSRAELPRGTRNSRVVTVLKDTQDIPASPIHPTNPAGLAAHSPITINSSDPLTDATFMSMVTLSASPAYAPPIAPKLRAQPQQPTFITTPPAPIPVNTINPPISKHRQEEICIECAMRDQEMADVDVTSPGVWDRESDVQYEELKQRELEEEVSGSLNADAPRTKARGGRLTEQNLRLWLSMNPREPASKQQTLHTYVKTQRTLLEEEGLAHARAMQEAKQLDSRMRNAYSQLRRSAYENNASSTASDDTGGGLRLKPPMSSMPGIQTFGHNRLHSREVTLLENGMIVEHVNVRKEEREERERRKKDDKRVRKVSRTSIVSVPSNGQHIDHCMGLKVHPHYYPSGSLRPSSDSPLSLDRPDLPRAHSQASFSDVLSISSTSPKRSKFLGFRNLSTVWRSRDSLTFSGKSESMIDMHLALQHDHLEAQPVELNTPRRSQIWSHIETDLGQFAGLGKTDNKKKSSLAKIWRLVTGSGKGVHNTSKASRPVEDDFPLTPPPPLSFLVDRSNMEMISSNTRHASSPSLPSITSNKLGVASPGMSPPTAPSTALPSPVSWRLPGADAEVAEVNINHSGSDDQEYQRRDEIVEKNRSHRKVHSRASEPDIRGQVVHGTLLPVPQKHHVTKHKSPSVLFREKSLPPLPGEIPQQHLIPVFNNEVTRPRSIYTELPQQLDNTDLLASDFTMPNVIFGRADIRRQSFGGMTSRPNMQGVLPRAVVNSETRGTLGLRYNQFGQSRRSLGRLEHTLECPAVSISSPAAKRRNKFLTSLLGKKSSRNLQPSHDENVDFLHQFPSMRRSGSDGQDEAGPSGYATSASRHSGMGGTYSHQRTSLVSRKVLEELVPQDPEFVAYRYPSNDQRLDLLQH
ncbi:hypothetical protein AMATHDRAFT_58835 [Amanita thiersii Skay4041]|uniref:Uncharacterized protein n=1 Tax=Amanita thiersii Skay4041 TaxID=703135 RepID=A0A2A9NLP8_9AGAR|nr:hypothetical protein AMATHDRAFT_58835 [Amanita thiersii Skay4041]